VSPPIGRHGNILQLRLVRTPQSTNWLDWQPCTIDTQSELFPVISRVYRGVTGVRHITAYSGVAQRFLVNHSHNGDALGATPQRRVVGGRDGPSNRLRLSLINMTDQADVRARPQRQRCTVHHADSPTNRTGCAASCDVQESRRTASASGAYGDRTWEWFHHVTFPWWCRHGGPRHTVYLQHTVIAPHSTACNV